MCQIDRLKERLCQLEEAQKVVISKFDDREKKEEISELDSTSSNCPANCLNKEGISDVDEEIVSLGGKQAQSFPDTIVTVTEDDINDLDDIVTEYDDIESSPSSSQDSTSTDSSQQSTSNDNTVFDRKWCEYNTRLVSLMV